MLQKPLVGLEFNEIQSIVHDLGMPKFATKQITSWLYDKRVNSIDEMTNLSLKHRDLLKSNFILGLQPPVKSVVSSDGTIKYLFQVGVRALLKLFIFPMEKEYFMCLFPSRM